MKLEGYEFIYDKYQTEISTRSEEEWYKEAQNIDDMWPVRAGSFIHILALYDPNHILKSIIAAIQDWQTAKLIGLANKQYFTTRASIYMQSLQMASQPEGYRELVRFVTKGDFVHKEQVYICCENLWTGLNKWFDELGICYRTNELPL